MDLMLMPLRRYADFQGRSRRKEYWMFYLGIIIVTVILSLLAGLTGGLAETDSSVIGTIFLGLLVLFYLAIFVPSLAVQVRRFHDQDKSGWLLLLAFVPIIGGLIVLVFMCLEGTKGPNRFGPDPKGVAETFA